MTSPSESIDHAQFRLALRDKSHPMAVLLRNMVDGVITIDLRGVIESFNPGAARIFGYTEDEALGRNVRFLMPDPDRNAHDRYIERYLETGKAAIIGIGREVTGQRKDGTTFPLELGIGEANLAGDKLFIATLRDLTLRKRLEQERQQAQKLEALGRLASSVAHDFNNLLMPIITITQLSHDGLPLDDPLRPNLETVLAAAQRGTKLIEQILKFSRPQPPDHRPIELSTVIREALSLLRSTTPSNIEIRWRSESASCVVMADPTQIHQILMNLVTNAIAAIGTRIGVIGLILQRVSIGVTDPPPSAAIAPGEFARLSVSDTGHGIQQDLQERIFEPFYTGNPESSGTGLGLTVVHGMTTALGGAVVMSSKVGRGTNFDIYLPITVAAGATAEQV